MNEHQGHRDRMRKRFLENGLNGFQSHEMLELLLFYAIPRADTNAISHALIDKFGSLSGVFEASVSDLKAVKGVGENAAVFLSMIPKIAREYQDDKNKAGIVLVESREIAKFVLPKFIGKNNEQVLIICMDKKGKVLSSTFLSEGGLDFVNLNIREIASLAIAVSASMIIIAHNHTQGFALPSPSDYHVTKKVADALKPLAIEVYDHIVVARDDCVSMRDSGFFAVK